LFGKSSIISPSFWMSRSFLSILDVISFFCSFLLCLLSRKLSCESDIAQITLPSQIQLAVVKFSISKAWFCISMFRIPAQARSSLLDNFDQPSFSKTCSQFRIYLILLAGQIQSVTVSFLSRKPDFVSQCLGYPHGPDQVCWQFLTTASFLENLFAISDIPNLASRPDPVGYHQFSISKAWFCISMFRIPAQARSSQLAVLCAAFFLENLFAISDIPNLASRPDPVSCLVNLYDSAHKAYWTVFFLESLFVNSILRKLHL
jgi:hypothetical protein